MNLSRTRNKLSSKTKEKNSFLKSLIALLLISLCFVAANWQYQRGVARHAKNFKIEANAKKSDISLELVTDLKENEWRTITATGIFDTKHEVLLRNHYSDDGVYGFEYLTLFKAQINSKPINFWVDRGWVQAGATATARPITPVTPTQTIELTGRLRLENSLPRGSFFALPAKGELINSWNLKSKVRTENFYIDLINADGITPTDPAELPELSDGPHMAYALQWLFFAGLIIYGRILIRKR